MTSSQSASELDTPQQSASEEDSDADEAPRSELEDLRAKLRARTAQLKAEAEARQAEQTQDEPSQEDLITESSEVMESASEDDAVNHIAEPEPESDFTADTATSDQDEEAALLAEWQQQLAESESSATVEADEGKEKDAEADIEQLTSDIELPAQNAPEVTAIDEADEAAILAQWEQQLAAESEQSQPPPVPQVEEDESAASDVPYSPAQAADIAEKEREEQEAEAALAEAWQQQTASSETEADEESLNPLPVNELDESDTEVEDPASPARPEEEEIDTGPPVNLTDAKVALSEMWDDLTEEPLPSEEDLASMFKEIKQLDQADDSEEDESATAKPRNKDELKSILSSIPSFSQMNKSSDS
jgi:hypothetical protein